MNEQRAKQPAFSTDLRFVKMEGTGNDFIMIDNRKGRFTGRETAFFAFLCRRRFSIGADGVVLVERGKTCPVRMRYFNSDGRPASMCGNALRCTALYAFEKGWVKKPAFDVEAPDGIHPVRVRRSGNGITVRMAPAFGFRTGLGIVRDAAHREGGFVNTGVPHFVVFTDAIDRVDVQAAAPVYRHHAAFPEGANVNFVQTMEDGSIAVRTFERGVEGETLSCGTGCVAAALVACKSEGRTSPVTVRTRGGTLFVSFNAGWTRIDLTGPAGIVFEGTWKTSRGMRIQKRARMSGGKT
jgi:diaminopimelate epimerase